MHFTKYRSLININDLCERERYVYTHQCTQNLSLVLKVTITRHMQNYRKGVHFKQTGAANRNPQKKRVN